MCRKELSSVDNYLFQIRYISLRVWEFKMGFQDAVFLLPEACFSATFPYLLLEAATDV